MHALNRLENTTKTRLARGEVARGLFLLTASPIVAECASTLGFDWLLVDGEAAPVGPREIGELLRAMNGSGVTPLVRVPRLDRHDIEHALDLGAHGVLVPRVDDADMARAVVDAALFPPHGRRGVNPVRASGYFSDVPAYLAAANARTLTMVQIESREAVGHVDAIAAVDGVDVLFVGPGDLAMSLGQPGVVGGPRMAEARALVVAAARAHGKVAGIFAHSPEAAATYRGEGFRFVAVGNDVAALRDGLAARLG